MVCFDVYIQYISANSPACEKLRAETHYGPHVQKRTTAYVCRNVLPARCAETHSGPRVQKRTMGHVCRNEPWATCAETHYEPCVQKRSRDCTKQQGLGHAAGVGPSSRDLAKQRLGQARVCPGMNCTKQQGLSRAGGTHKHKGAGGRGEALRIRCIPCGCMSF